MEQNIVERATKTKTDAKNSVQRSGQAWLVGVKRHKLQHPYHVKVSPWAIATLTLSQQLLTSLHGSCVQHCKLH